MLASKMNKIYTLFCILIISGCATIQSRTDGLPILVPSGKVTKVYPAVVYDCKELYDIHWNYTYKIPSVVILIVDLPISIITDTILLPYDLIVWESDKELKCKYK